MQVSNVNQNEFESIFGNNPTPPQSSPHESGFGFETAGNSLFGKQEKKDDVVPPPADPTSPPPTDDIPKDDDTEDNKDDSLFKQEVPKDDIPTSPLIKDYFEARIKEGKFLPFEDGEIKTLEDVDALIELNFEHKLSEIGDQVRTSAYNNMSQAWRFVLENSEKFSTPAELIPLLQGVDNIDTVSSFDPTDENQAEMLVRMALKRRGEPSEIVEEQINTFKENKSLVKLATQYQPILVNEENQRLIQMRRQQEIKELADLDMIKRIHDNAITNLETPFLGKHKLKQEEKAEIYKLVAQPQRELGGGYKIFEAIDNLYEKNDFDTLKEIALLLSNKDSYRKYMGVSVGNQVAEGLMRKLKTTQTGNTSFDTEDPRQPKPLKGKPLTPTESGFGFFKK